MASEFIEIDVIQVTQKNCSFYVGKMQCADILSTYTVNPVEYDLERQKVLLKTYKDESEYFQSLIDEDERRLRDFKEKGFQREFDETRVSEIGKFLNDEIYPLFPNAIIATCDLLNNIPSLDTLAAEDIPSALKEHHNLAFFDETNKKLFIPNVKKALVIIDGQHRIEGLKRASQEVKNGYEVLVSFIIGMDRSVIAKLFYTINYTQKSVNKSLLYHLASEFSRDVNEITFLHEMVNILNVTEASPFYSRIKMMGKSDITLPPAQRKLMTVSQAFMIDYLMYTVEEKTRRRHIFPIFLYYFKNNCGYLAVRFLMRFFMAVSEIMTPEWDNPDQSIISKTLGVGSLLKAMNFVFVKLFIEKNLESNPEAIDTIKKSDLIANLNGLGDIDWDAYQKGSSAGQVNVLRDEILRSIAAFTSAPKEDFYTWFTEEYGKPYWEWHTSAS